MEYVNPDKLQQAVDNYRGKIYLRPKRYNLDNLTINQTGVELIGAGAATGRRSWAKWSTYLKGNIEIDSLKTGKIRGVKLKDLVMEGDIKVNEDASDGNLDNVIFRKSNIALTLEDGCTGWHLNLVSFFNMQQMGALLKGRNHRTTFDTIKASATSRPNGHAVITIGQNHHCSGITFNACDLEHRGMKYQIDADRVRALSITGGYMEALQAEKAFIKLGRAEGGKIDGAYFNGANKMPHIFDIDYAPNVVIEGNHFRSFTNKIAHDPLNFVGDLSKTNFTA